MQKDISSRFPPSSSSKFLTSSNSHELPTLEFSSHPHLILKAHPPHHVTIAVPMLTDASVPSRPFTSCILFQRSPLDALTLPTHSASINQALTSTSVHILRAIGEKLNQSMIQK